MTDTYTQPVYLEKSLKIKNDITILTDKHWDIGLLQEHRSIILVQELKVKGYKKGDFEELYIPSDIRDKYDYGSLVEDILFYFDHKPISVENAQEIFYNQKIIPNTIGLLYFINSSIRKCPHDDYRTSFAEKWRFFQKDNAGVAITKLEKFLEKYTPSNGFDKLIYDFYRQFPGLLKSGLVIKDSDRVSALQEYIKHLFDESVQEIESKEKGRVNEKNILPRMRDKIDHVIFNDYKLEIKMILGGHYRNEMPGSSDWTDYRELVSKLLDLETNQKKTQEEKQIHDKLKVKYYSRLLPEERKGVF